MTIPAWYINLDNRPERRAYMQQHLLDLDLTVERFSAIDANSLSDAEASVWQDSTHNITKSELCCFLSHRNIWEKIAEGDEEYGVIFEDDILLSPGIKEFLETTDWIPENTGLIRFETTCLKVKLGAPEADLFQTRKLHPLHSTHLGAAGYVLSKNVAMDMLKKSQKVTAPLDIFMFELDFGFEPKQIVPALCVQQQFYKKVFLPDAAKESSLAQGRRIRTQRNRPQGIALVYREIMRVVMQIRRVIRDIIPGFKYVPVDFR
ncbi:glycosyltransferase family 25 protein [Halocynthiibacter namhaensis]|uniref:glycosyltransferase family 25 protein n=1 Tax=Halocynthiibacter namhaensis TaxID=1290553 RepID=UPI0005796635|nr:glycosyltransferase family 25 protein [Halocynthiibacter namhaensis]